MKAISTSFLAPPMNGMETGDGQTEGGDGSGVTRRTKRRSATSGIDGSEGHSSVQVQRRPIRLKTATAKVRENREVEAVLKSKAVEAATTAKTAVPKADASFLVAADQNQPNVCSNDCYFSPSCSVHSTEASASELSELVGSLSLKDDAWSDSDSDGDDEATSETGDDVDEKENNEKDNITDDDSMSPAKARIRFNRRDGECNCDFESHDSINYWYPKYKSKGDVDIPLFLVRAARSKRGKAVIVKEWRRLTKAQQYLRVKEERDRFHSLRERERNNRRKRSVDDIAVEVGDVGNQQPAPPRKKRRTLDDDRNVLGSYEEMKMHGSELLRRRKG